MSTDFCFFVKINDGCSGASWRALTSLEKKLMFLSILLGIVVFALTLALATHKCPGIFIMLIIFIFD